jgi:hypothetical protein
MNIRRCTMKRRIFLIMVTILACGVLLAPAMSQAKTGVIMHDHGAPGKIDDTADPYIGHDDNFLYGLKLFLRHMIMLNVIPNITIGGPPPTSGGAADIGTTYFPTDHFKGYTYAAYECAGGSESGLDCYVDSDCDGGTCEVSLNIIDSTSTATDTGSSASLTETGQDFSSYKAGNHVILAGMIRFISTIVPLGIPVAGAVLQLLVLRKTIGCGKTPHPS